MTRPPIPRLPDWRERMVALITERLHAPFVWGRNDCVLFAADAVLAMTGVDHAASLRGLGQRQAMRLLRRKGGVAALATLALGRPGQAAQVGDILLLCNGGRNVLAVFNGTLGLSPGAQGLVGVPVTAALAAWRV